MNDLSGIYRHFSVQERQEFKQFIIRQQPRSGRKDLLFLEELEGKIKAKPTRSKMAYHSLRKRLMQQLADFILLKEVNSESNSEGKLVAQLTRIRFYSENNFRKDAEKLAKKTLRVALETENYSLSSQLILLQIEQQLFQNEEELQELIKLYHQEIKNAQEENQLLIATALIKQKLESIKQSAELKEFPQYVESVLKRYAIHNVLFNKPAHLYRMMEIVRNSYLAMRQMKNFESFAVRQYNRFKKHRIVNEKHNYFHIQILYMLAHVYFRNRKFKQAQETLTKMGECIANSSYKQASQFKPKFNALLCSIKSMSGKIEDAIFLHEEYNATQPKLSASQQLNRQLNLAFFYFAAKQFKKANKLFLVPLHSDKWIEIHMGKEWLLRYQLIQLLIHYELGREDISLRMLKKIEKQFSKFFEIPQYTKVKGFIRALKTYMEDPYSLNFKTFRSMAEVELFSDQPDEEESKAIAFYCWLKSKLLQQDYYLTLLEEV